MASKPIHEYDVKLLLAHWLPKVPAVHLIHKYLTAPAWITPSTKQGMDQGAHGQACEAVVLAFLTRAADLASVNKPPLSPALLEPEEHRLQAARVKVTHEQAQYAIEIDLDKDGPLREDSAPAAAADTVNANVSQNWHNGKVVQHDKSLPPPARWSPAANELILHERNRASGHYVAVQPPLLPLGYPNQNWPPGPTVPFVAVKPPALLSMGMGYVFDAPPLHVAHAAATASAYPISIPARNPFLTIKIIHTHIIAGARARSCRHSSSTMVASWAAVGSLAPIMRWLMCAGDGAHYGYPAPAFARLAQNLSRSVSSCILHPIPSTTKTTGGITGPPRAAQRGEHIPDDAAGSEEPEYPEGYPYSLFKKLLGLNHPSTVSRGVCR
ncbi:hypothetical protein B0H14DRAFT_3523059 [Mycena olivaceomarginata]|nr:hypothetical protein B0H14DRAFT_3523059 [Mycena olivaceomarginata]